MDPLLPLINNLNADGRPRVWSLVITVFGDLVQHRGGRVQTVRLSQLLGRVGIESGALRTALSRLSRDGWVEGRKTGRTSSYKLTPSGVQQFGPATARIYAAPRTKPVQTWRFSLSHAPGALRVAGGWLHPGKPISKGFELTGTLGKHSGPEIWGGLAADHKQALNQLALDLLALTGTDLPMIDAAAARTLLIHRWRRIVLRYPEVPAEFFPTEFPVQALHQQVAALYHRLTPQTEAWLDTAAGEMPAMPTAKTAQTNRFGLSQNA